MAEGQITSLSNAALVISLIMFLVFRSAAIAGLSMIPNFFPIALNFSIVGAFGIPLNTGTSLIAAVSLGIAVDDTFISFQNTNGNGPKSGSLPKPCGPPAMSRGRRF